MKKRNKLLIIIVVLLLIILPIFNAIFFWGICFDQDGGFEYSASRLFLEDTFPGQVESSIHIEDGNRTIGLPFVILFYPLDNPSYNINIFLRDESQSMRRIAIESITIRYDDGEEKQKQINYSKDFSASFYRKRENDGHGSKIPVMSLEARLYSIVDRSKSCTIKLSGYVMNSEGQKIPFATNNYFEYKPTSWRVYTGTEMELVPN